MGMTPTGNGRRESYAHLPMPRMTNTYMLPGKSTRKKLLNPLSTVSMHRTLVAVRWISPPANSCFSTSEAYLIENGKVTKPVKAQR